MWRCSDSCRGAGAGGGLRLGRGGRRLLAREELVGPLVGRPGLHQDGAQQEQPLRHRLLRLLPARLTRGRAARPICPRKLVFNYSKWSAEKRRPLDRPYTFAALYKYCQDNTIISRCNALMLVARQGHDTCSLVRTRCGSDSPPHGLV